MQHWLAGNANKDKIIMLQILRHILVVSAIQGVKDSEQCRALINVINRRIENLYYKGVS